MAIPWNCIAIPVEFDSQKQVYSTAASSTSTSSLSAAAVSRNAMPKNKLTDFDELLAKSQRLLSSHNDGSITRNLNRGVAELAESSKLLARGGDADQSNLEAFRILSQRNFDAKRLQEDVNSIKIKPTDDSTMQLEPTDIDGYLAHHHDMIVLSAIEDARRASEEDVQEMQRRWMMNEWTNARTGFMESLGHRANRWENIAGVNTPLNKQAITDAMVPYEARNQRSTHKTLQTTSAFGAATTPAFRGFTSPQATTTAGAGSLVNFSFDNLITRPAVPVLSPLMTGHCSIVRELNTNSRVPADYTANASAGVDHTTTYKPCKQLKQTINIPSNASNSSVVTDGLTRMDMIAYKEIVELLSFCVGEQQNKLTQTNRITLAPNNTASTSTAGYFAPICFDPTDVNDSVLADRKRILTAGAKAYFENQSWEIWTRVVDEAVATDDLTVLASNEGTSNMQKLRSYVGYQYDIGAIPAQCASVQCTYQRVEQLQHQYHQQQQQRLLVPMWAFIYHCMRVGDFDGAITELNSSINSGRHDGEVAVLSVLRVFQNLVENNYSASSRRNMTINTSGSDSNSGNSKKALGDNEVKGFCDAVNNCRVHYDHEINKDELHHDPYRCIVFNLCGLADRDGVASYPFPGFTIEDFLWSNMWFVHMHRLLCELAGVSQTLHGMMSSVFRTSAGYLINGEAELFNTVLECGGADYFDQDRSSPFRYATVLFSCHRFGDAIAHLWLANKTIPAVHLTALCLHYGLILPHVPLSQNPSHALVSNRSIGYIADPSPSSILSVYTSSELILCYPDICVDYLISMDCNWIARVPGISGDYRDNYRLKVEQVVLEVLEQFLITMRRDQLHLIVGAPIADPMATNNSTTTNAATSRCAIQCRTSGRLNEYLDDSRITALLATTGFHLLTLRGESEAAIYFYLLAGKYVEVIEEYCRQLALQVVALHADSSGSSGGGASAMTRLDVNSNTINRSLYWKQASEDFIHNYLTQEHSLIVQYLNDTNNYHLMIALKVLTGLLDFMEAQRSQDYHQALQVIYTLNILPPTVDQVDGYTSIIPQLRSILDVVVLQTMCCIVESYQVLAANKRMQLSRPNILSNSDLELQQLKAKSRAIVLFASKVKHNLNNAQDTLNSVTRTDSLLI